MKQSKKVSGRLLALALTLIMMLSMLCIPASAATDAVNAASSGVVQLNVCVRLESGEDDPWFAGSAFLINDTTIVTCAHVVQIEDSDIAAMADYYGKTANWVRDHLVYDVIIRRDVAVEATLNTASSACDFAILDVSQAIGGRTPLTLGNSSELQLTDPVFAIGFPGLSDKTHDIPTYTADDVTITDGIVNKMGTGGISSNDISYDYIQTSVKLVAGNSGGPLVNERGEVVGICEGAAGDSYTQDDFFYAIDIQQVIETLKGLNIAFTQAGTNGSTISAAEASAPAETTEDAAPEEAAEAAEPEVDKSELEALIAENEDKSADSYTKESYSAFEEALDDAKGVLADSDADQNAVNTAKRNLASAATGLEEKSNTMMFVIIGVVAAVLVIVIVILIVVVNSSKSKKRKVRKVQPQPAPQPAAPKPVAPQPAPATVPMPAAVETTVLAASAPETTILSKNVNGGTLIRKNGNERVAVNAEEFVIGREKSKVNYCISNNTAVGRTHAKILIRNGRAYLVDLKATNGTFINGTKCSPMQEYPLNNGDKVTFADEEFTYQA